VLAGLLRVLTGEVRLEGMDITAWPAHARARAGLRTAIPSITLVPSLTVREHLRLALGDPAVARLDELSGLLEERADTAASLLSGGMQRVLATAVALAGRPKVLLVDDVAEGLQPSVVAVVLASLSKACEGGAAMVVVDRSVAVLEQICDRVLLLDNGKPVMDLPFPLADTARRDLEARVQWSGKQA
jgi:ABC-type branched-subunit amino acid transport system ATPase component